MSVTGVTRGNACKIMVFTALPGSNPNTLYREQAKNSRGHVFMDIKS